jgi:hypothetical protein
MLVRRYEKIPELRKKNKKKKKKGREITHGHSGFKERLGPSSNPHLPWVRSTTAGGHIMMARFAWACRVKKRRHFLGARKKKRLLSPRRGLRPPSPAAAATAAFVRPRGLPFGSSLQAWACTPLDSNILITCDQHPYQNVGPSQTPALTDLVMICIS